MGHGHAHGGVETDLTPAQKQQQRMALRVLVAVLVPLAVLTFASLVWLWPHDTASHVRNDTGTVRVPGTTVQVATIIKVTEIECVEQIGTFPGDTSTCARLTVRLEDGPDVGSTQEVDLTAARYESGADVGQKVRLYRVPAEGMTIYSFVDFERTTPLVFFVGLFAVLVVAVARWRGLLSLVGLGFAFWILTQFMLPNLIQGKDPLLVGIVASGAIMFVVLYVSHGFTLRTTTALVGTLFGLLVSAILGSVGTRWSHLTGITHEDDYMLAASAPDLKLTSVVVVSIIVAALGALNDVTITQASAVWELARNEERAWRLYTSAMRIGRDHIASTVYTIAFAAAGGAMAVLLLINVYHQPMAEMLVEEMFAGEILRTVIGSIGLVLAVPLTTVVGVLAVSAGRAAQRRACDSTTTASSPITVLSPPSPTSASTTPPPGTSPVSAPAVVSPASAEEEAASRPRRGQASDHSAFRRPDAP